MRWPGFVVALLLLTVTLTVSAEDTPREFLRALWAEGLTHKALEYIDTLEASVDTSPELRAELGYLRGLTKLAAARDAKLPADERKSGLNEAHQAIQDFITDHPRHNSIVEARQELANVLVEAARLLAAEGEREIDEAKAKAALTKSRRRYAQAITELDTLLDQIRVKLQNLPRAIAPANGAAIAERDKLRASYIQVQMIAAICQVESAKTHRDAMQRNEGLKEAADTWGEIYEKYRRRLAGLYALLHQGKCYEEMGEHDEALTYYQELLEQPADGGPFRDLRTKVLVRVMVCLNAQGKSKRAIELGESWLSKQRPEEEKQDDWLELQMELARAYIQQAANEVGEKQAEHLTAAATLAKKVIAAQSKHADAARRLYAELDPDKPAPMAEDPVSFTEAIRKGRDALERFQTATLQSELIRAKLETETSAQAQTKLLKQLETVQTTSLDALTDAGRNFERGLALIPGEAEAKDESQARYLLAYVCHQQQRYLQAIDAALPILEHALDEPSAQPAARIVLASRIALWNGAGNMRQRREQGDAIIVLEALVRRTWPQSELAETARIAVERVKTAVDSPSVED